MSREDVLDMDAADYARHLGYAAKVLASWNTQLDLGGER